VKPNKIINLYYASVVGNDFGAVGMRKEPALKD